MRHERDDPIFAALERWKSADEEFAAWRGRYKNAERNHREQGLIGTSNSDRLLIALEEESQPICAKRNEILRQLYETKPSTLSGLAALVQVFVAEDLVEADGLAGSAMTTICKSFLSLLETPE